jgi:hypothetical protein
VALVIGNGAYATSPLANPPKDANLVASALRAVGFEVIEQTNVDQRQMKLAIEEFGENASSSEVALFYFAGHGVQVNGRNYLIPVGANIRSEGEVDIEAVDLARVLTRLDQGHARMKLVILDACRNNPFERSYRSDTRGLAFVSAPHGTLIAYATSPGSVAEDGSGGNSAYSAALAQQVRVPGLGVEEVFKRVRTQVRNETNERQTPWESSSIEGQFYFVADGSVPQGVEPAPAATPTTTGSSSNPQRIPPPTETHAGPMDTTGSDVELSIQAGIGLVGEPSKSFEELGSDESDLGSLDAMSVAGIALRESQSSRMHWLRANLGWAEGTYYEREGGSGTGGTSNHLFISAEQVLRFPFRKGETTGPDDRIALDLSAGLFVVVGDRDDVGLVAQARLNVLWFHLGPVFTVGGDSNPALLITGGPRIDF